MCIKGAIGSPQVWLYILKVLPGLSRKLAHLGYGPFRIEQVRDDFKVKLKVQGTGYRVEPWVHITQDDDFDEALLPEHSWEPNSAYQEYEVEGILDLKWTKCTRNAKRVREYLVKWKGYDGLQWLPVS
ncbi:hypothetical protein PHMEG_00017215 [Phytophthora megakarya]|uniref:Chromo domain-containing protein n=1 Tax=Phytophthora megakarya TaxID=4795 RepID=A0A225VX53_9STRA|nr:hypothetical protein PHMEG_00017215 [Phytophthora megakarya]